MRRRLAGELHVDLQNVHGSGRMGELRTQMWTFICGARCRHQVRGGRSGRHTTEIQMVGMRRRIAEKMVVSDTQIPHFSYIEEIDITELETLREHLNTNRTDGQPKLTYLPFEIMLAVTRALARFPELNAHYDVKREVITRYEAVHLGVATQTDAWFVCASGAARGNDGLVAGGARCGESLRRPAIIRLR